MNGAAESDTLRWIPLIPLVVATGQALLLGAFRRPLAPSFVRATSLGAPLLSFVLTCIAFWELAGLSGAQTMLVDRVHTWIGVGLGSASFTADVAFQLDALSAVMALVCTTVVSVATIYAATYMQFDSREDGGEMRFFCLLNYFLFSVLTLALAENLVLFFVGWAGVSLTSYALIGFWHADADAGRVANRALALDRLGDLAFGLGTLLVFWSLAAIGEASVSFQSIRANAGEFFDAVLVLPNWLGGSAVDLPATMAGCFAVAALIRASQGPLFVFLQDAMRAPLPASAIVHTALGAPAGVYLLCRLSFLLELSPKLGASIAWIGGATALLAALVSIAQVDLKRLLASVSVVNVGWMFVAVGCGAYTAAIFQLVTHAFFITLLFAAAGAVILAMHGERDMRVMGGLRTKLLRVHGVMLGAVAIAAGFPLLPGFLARNEILFALEASELPAGDALFVISLGVIVLTAFALCRMLFLVFYGNGRLPARVRGDMEDPERPIVVPLYVLAGLSVFSGLVGLPQFWGDMVDVPASNSLANFVTRDLAMAAPEEGTPSRWPLVALTTFGAVLGLAVAMRLYVGKAALPGARLARFADLQESLKTSFGLDRLYELALVPIRWVASRVLVGWVEQNALRRAMLLPGRVTRATTHSMLAYLQPGLAPAYLFSMVAGTILLLGYLVF